MTTSQSRDLDIVVFGATGFTGALTAEYLATNGPADTRWALAGRNRSKLEALRERLGVDVPIMEADAGDPASLRRVAESTRVVITTVGPYLRHGEPLVAACAEAGTDYVDLTGESEFVDLMYLRHHATAVRTGARLVHACGFDSIPPDLGALFTVQQLPPDRPIRLRGYVSGSGRPSGGTFDTMLEIMSRRRSAAATHTKRRDAERASRDGGQAGADGADPDGARLARTVGGRAGFERELGAWVMPLPTIDPQIVVRSARALERYGPDFSYTHYGAVGGVLTATGLALGAAGAFAFAQFGPSRRALSRLRPPGAGPTAAQRDKGWFRLHFVGQAGGRRVLTEVAGGDPGYGETSKMLAESALCLANDDLPATAGQVTTAVAMGDALRARLEKAGMSFRVLQGG